MIILAVYLLFTLFLPAISFAGITYYFAENDLQIRISN